VKGWATTPQQEKAEGQLTIPLEETQIIESAGEVSFIPDQ
jgi:ethanolamine utilization protein EutQ (cupin superfamily)